MALQTRPFDAAVYLTDDELQSGYLADALNGDDPRLVPLALQAVIRAGGGTQDLAQRTGISEDLLSAAARSETPDRELLEQIVVSLSRPATTSRAA